MNWKRVLAHVALAFAATAVAGFVPSFVRGAYAASGGTPPLWLDLLQAALVQLALLLVFVRLGRVQRRRPWGHAALVWAGAGLLSAVNLLLGVPFVEFVASVALAATVAVIGVAIGLRVRPVLPAPAESPVG